MSLVTLLVAGVLVAMLTVGLYLLAMVVYGFAWGFAIEYRRLQRPCYERRDGV
ncbi:MAG: hypothetical protein QXG03_06620 [Halalkalicoccus sp.]